jgi:hypothetical protein
MKWRPLKSAAFSEGSWVMLAIIHNYHVGARTVLAKRTIKS